MEKKRSYTRYMLEKNKILPKENSEINNEIINESGKELKIKKIKIDISIKKTQDNIKNIFENILRCENDLNNYIANDTNLDRNYSPCYIISKKFITEFKQLFNYDYYKKNEIFNIDIIQHQRKNNNIIYINDLTEITLNDFKNNNIYILDEITFISLYNIIPSLEKNKNENKIYDIFLNKEKGIISIKEGGYFLFIFETKDISDIQKFELINFYEDKNNFIDVIQILEKNNISDDLWKKLIYNYCNNCNFIIDDNDSDDINEKIKKLVDKINIYKLFFQNNQMNLHNEIVYEKMKGFQSALNLYESLLNEKEIFLQRLIGNNNNFNINNNPINNNQNNNINIINTQNNFNNININNTNNNINDSVIKLNRFMPSLGLGNIGSTCYMNATLQSLAHIPELAEALLTIYNFNKNLFSNLPLTKEFIILMINIYFPKGNRIMFEPYNIKNEIGKKEKLFGGNEAEDAKDLYLFLIESMNSELNGGNEQIYNDIIKLRIDTRDPLKIKETFLNEFNNKNNNSIISKLLYGFSQTSSECLKCRNIKYNYECFNFLIFPLADVKYYIKNCKADYNEQYILNLEDCFLYNQKFEFFEGNNKMKCFNCNSLENGKIQRLIDTAPQILVIILDRGINHRNFNDKFDFFEYLDINDYVMDKRFTKYYLSGVITHLGQSGPFGHFVFFNKMDINAQWYLYNDSSVTLCNSKNDVFYTGKPYILFYHILHNIN